MHLVATNYFRIPKHKLTKKLDAYIYVGRDFWIQILKEYILKFMQVKVNILEKSSKLLPGTVENLNTNKLRCIGIGFQFLCLPGEAQTGK